MLYILDTQPPVNSINHCCTGQYHIIFFLFENKIKIIKEAQFTVLWWDPSKSCSLLTVTHLVTLQSSSTFCLLKPAHSSGLHIRYTIKILKAVQNTFRTQFSKDTRPLHYAQTPTFSLSRFFFLSEQSCSVALWRSDPWVNVTTLKSHKQCQLCPRFSLLTSQTREAE